MSLSLPPLDVPFESNRIERFLVDALARRLNRRGVVLGVSGGVDSAVCASLAVRALGPERVFALLMPESQVSDGGTERALDLCRQLGVRHVVEDITESLEAIGCYRRAEEAIRRLVPEFGPGWRHKIVLAAGGHDGTGLPFFSLVVESPDGACTSQRMPADVYLQVVAATNFKQRVRKSLEYFHAERLNHAVLGTPNRLEYELGFFVRGGDGLADVKPIAHLFKTHVYSLAQHLDVPDDIRRQAPSTGTYSLPQTQEEFYFALPYDRADLLLHGMTVGVAADEICRALDCAPPVVDRLRREFTAKRRVAERSLGEALVVE
ncbi:MAG: NAD(+) synthase [Alphaproteobacteria bacterium]